MSVNFPPIVRALGSRNYRLFFSAQAVSQTGLWMQRLAMGWLVYRLTDSPRALGIIDFFASFPTVLLIPLTSFILPRVELRSVLLLTQALLMGCAALIGGLTLSGHVTYLWLGGIALLMGVINAFDMPIRQSMVVYMVDRKEDVPNAVALNSSMFNVARLIGPTIAGMAIHRVGEGICFLLNAAAYSSTIVAVKAMRLTRSTVADDSKGGGGLRNIAGTFAMMKAFPPLAHILLLVTAIAVFGVPYLALMPAMAKTVLGGTSRTMGLLLMSVGGGALAGSLVMAARKSPVGLDRWAIRCSISFGAAVALFALSRHVLLSMLLLVFVGFFMVSTTISCNTFLQTFVDDAHRSSMMSLYVAAITGIAPIGSIIVGQMGEMIGTAGALCASGLVCVIFSLAFSMRLNRYRHAILRTLRAKGFSLKEGRKWEW